MRDAANRTIELEPDDALRLQYAALPWRLSAGGLIEVLLITSRETRRWVVPKGWPIKGLAPHLSAAREAFEEAGIEGEAAAEPIGAYHYDKRRRTGVLQPVRVLVYPLAVAAEQPHWPEREQRNKLWAAPGHAAGLVDEPELQALIAAFGG